MDLSQETIDTLKPVFTCVRTFYRSMKTHCCELEKDTRGTQWDQGDFTPELVEFLKKEESYITGEEMEECANQRDDLAGQRHLEAMLLNQERIPAEWEPFTLIAPKTVWVYSVGDRNIPFLRWNTAEGWYLGLCSIADNEFDRRYRFVHLSR